MGQSVGGYHLELSVAAVARANQNKHSKSGTVIRGTNISRGYAISEFDGYSHTARVFLRQPRPRTTQSSKAHYPTFDFVPVSIDNDTTAESQLSADHALVFPVARAPSTRPIADSTVAMQRIGFGRDSFTLHEARHNGHGSIITADISGFTALGQTLQAKAVRLLWDNFSDNIAVKNDPAYFTFSPLSDGLQLAVQSKNSADAVAIAIDLINRISDRWREGAVSLRFGLDFGSFHVLSDASRSRALIAGSAPNRSRRLAYIADNWNVIVDKALISSNPDAFEGQMHERGASHALLLGPSFIPCEVVSLATTARHTAGGGGFQRLVNATKGLDRIITRWHNQVASHFRYDLDFPSDIALGIAIGTDHADQTKWTWRGVDFLGSMFLMSAMTIDPDEDNIIDLASTQSRILTSSNGNVILDSHDIGHIEVKPVLGEFGKLCTVRPLSSRGPDQCRIAIGASLRRESSWPDEKLRILMERLSSFSTGRLDYYIAQCHYATI